MLEKSYRAVPDGKTWVWIGVRIYSCQDYPSAYNTEEVTEVSLN